MTQPKNEYLASIRPPEPERIGGAAVRNTVASNALAETLTSHNNLDSLVHDFDAGKTKCVDLAWITQKQRSDIIKASQGKAVPVEELMLAYFAADNGFRLALNPDSDYVAPEGGYRFLKEAADFTKQGYPWARALSDMLDVSPRVLVDNFDQDARLNDYRGGAHVFVTDAVKPPGSDEYQMKALMVIAEYLAYRSELLQQRHTAQYGELLETAKSSASVQVTRLGAQYGLNHQAQQRAIAQLQRTTMGGNDPLMPFKGRDADRVGGYCKPYTLQVVCKPVGELTPSAVMHHEVGHAASAQASEGNSGLDPVDVNEGMTEYLAQEMLGFPDVVEPTGAEPIGIKRKSGYHLQLGTMIACSRNAPQYFAVLYQGYYGQVDDPKKLAEAIQAYDRVLANVKQYN